MSKSKTLIAFALVSAAALMIAGCGDGSFTDPRDGKKYGTVVIGDQTWMSQNINYKTDDGSYCYDDDESNCDKYGRLYDWHAATKACPAGWHLPNSAEWRILFNAVESERKTDKNGFKRSEIGMKLRASTGWDSCNGENNYGFSALPGGSRRKPGGFLGIGYSAYWWSSDGTGGIFSDPKYPSSLSVRYCWGDVLYGPSHTNCWYSVRCLKGWPPVRLPKDS